MSDEPEPFVPDPKEVEALTIKFLKIGHLRGWYELAGYAHIALTHVAEQSPRRRSAKKAEKRDE